jgi:phospholipid transport system substrate-binding protein
MNMKVSVIILTVSILLLLTTSMVTAQSAVELQKLMELRDQQIKTLVGPKGTVHTTDQTEKLKDIINGIIDYKSMAKIALQSTFETISEEQRTEFVDLFSTIIRDQSLNKLDIYRASVVYEKIDVSGSTAVVQTTATLDNVRTPVTYNMERRGADWFITDMAIDNVSTAESYRRSFQNMIRRRGFDALLENLRTRAGA